jgi:Tfp pilus assembly protein PilO
MTRYFTDSVSWVTDLTPYLPQDVAGHYEEKMTQVSAVKSLRLITLDDWNVRNKPDSTSKYSKEYFN